MREAGFPIETPIWHGLFAPAATPTQTTARIEAAVRAPAVIQGHERIQTPIVHFNARDVETMRRVIEENGLRQDG